MTQSQLEALYEFNYWLGLPTFKQFKKMLKAIDEELFIKASKEMLDSKVGRVYHKRVTILAKKLVGDR